MKTYGSFKAAIGDMPKCLVGSSCDDSVGIETEAKANAENPLHILRDLVRTEIDLIEEGEAEYNQPQQRIIRGYYARLCASS